MTISRLEYERRVDALEGDRPKGEHVYLVTFSTLQGSHVQRVQAPSQEEAEKKVRKWFKGASIVAVSYGWPVH